MIRRLALVGIAMLSLSPLRAEVRRALIVGIDDYMQPDGAKTFQLSASAQTRMRAIHGRPSRTSPPSLKGAVNDAVAIEELLVERFGFEKSNIILLTNHDATADRILELLQSHLIDAAQPGDASFFYYAGHGSRIRNISPVNTHTGGYDSTIVPADAGLGVPDVRSKELARIYSQAPAKGISLTVILDSCYSGAATRGPLTEHRIRAQPPDGEISVDEELEGPLPEDRGVLFISAAQEYEPAAELANSDLDGPHGAFTWALLHVLGASAPDDPVDRIFQRVRAMMQSVTWDQEPVMLAREGRNRRGLLGDPAQLQSKGTVAVAGVRGPIIFLNGGLAANLHEDCELVRVSPKEPEVSIRITKVDGLARSQAVVLRAGAANAPIRPGDLFELSKWVVPDRELMRVWIGPATPPKELNRMSAIAAGLAEQVTLVDDPSAQTPTHTLRWNPAKSRWTLTENRADAKPAALRQISAREIARRLPPSARLYIEAGPTQELMRALQFPDRAIVAAETPEGASYALLGRFCGAGCVEYAWVDPSASRDRKSLTPPRTDWFASNQAAAKLTETAYGLARITGWLHLNAPGFDADWPYRLMLQKKTGDFLSSPDVHVSEEYKLMLEAPPGELPVMVPARRVYVFEVNSFGETQLVFGDNLENEFPRIGQINPPRVIPLTAGEADFAIGTPYGVDHFFLLATSTPIDNPRTVFDSAGVRTRGGQSNHPLARLLEQRTSAARGSVEGIPPDWSIQHLTLVTLPAAAK